jgi:hypothetical protein
MARLKPDPQYEVDEARCTRLKPDPGSVRITTEGTEHTEPNVPDFFPVIPVISEVC